MSTTETNDEVTSAAATAKRAVAKHELLDGPNGSAARMEDATGYRYTVLENGKSFELDYASLSEDAKRMLCLFGAKTKATNEASRVRQDNGSADDQLEAIDEVFEQIASGVWREKAEGGGGSRTDKALLAQVLVEMLGDKAQGTVDTYQNRLETEKDYARKVMSNDAIKAEYRKRAGKTGPAIDSLV